MPAGCLFPIPVNFTGMSHYQIAARAAGSSQSLAPGLMPKASYHGAKFRKGATARR